MAQARSGVNLADAGILDLCIRKVVTSGLVLEVPGVNSASC